VTAERVVNRKQLSALIREGVSTRDRTASITSTFRERIGEAVENGNLNRKAFNIALGLAKMKDEVARDRAIRDLPLYIDMLREEGIFPAEHVGDLVDDAEAAAAEEQAGDADERDPAAAAADAAFSAQDGVEPQKPKLSSRRGKAAMGDAESTYTLKH
jgi:hypothetical protein